MRLGREIGIQPIKYTNHISNKELDEIVYKANDILYNNSCRYISTGLQEKIMEDLINVGKEASGATYNGQVEQRRVELVNGLRNAFKSLKSYTSDNDIEQSQKSVNYLVAQTIKKKGEMTEYEILDFFQRYREMKKYYPSASNWNTIDKLYDELVVILNEKVKR